MRFKIFFAMALATAFIYTACTNSSDYLYDESESTFIEVSAEMAYSFDSVSERSKADTLHPGDSLIFIANIIPSKSIKIKRYIWTLDGIPFSNDFSFRSAVWEPGLHKIAFILETFFGDTLSDTLTLQISNPPILQDSSFIPAKGSQRIPTTGGLSFAWNGYDPDSIAKLYYRFTIDGLIDTILDVPYFTYWKDLEPLNHYRWHVQAINEFGFASDNTIEGNFFTSGGPNESGITGFIDLSARDAGNAFAYSAKISILDTTNGELFSDIVKGGSQSALPFVISPLNEGKYRAVFSLPNHPDFVCDTIDFKLFANDVLELDTVRLRDTIAPTIAFIGNESANVVIDSLEYADTLRFLITDHGTPQSKKTVQAYLESVLLSEKNNVSDTFTVVLPSNTKSWNRRLLDIVATDASKNRTIRNYIIEPAENWIQTNKPFSTSGSKTIDLFIIDSNPYGFEINSCKFIINDDYVFQKSSPGGNVCTVRTSTAYLIEGNNTIRSIIEYTNGISHWKTWNITYTKEE